MHDFAIALPEIFLAVAAMALLMIGVFQKPGSDMGLVSWLSILSLAVALVLVVTGEGDNVSFAGLFVVLHRQRAAFRRFQRPRQQRLQAGGREQLFSDA